MVSYDPAWDMPEENWQPESSYLAPIAVPSSPPDGGTTLCLPPISQDWLPLIIGCLDQLRNPATWGALSNPSMMQVLSWVEQLKVMVADASACEMLRWSDSACAVQYSDDGGATWHNISGWPLSMPPACLVGATGATGAAGAPGAPGAPGATGATGATGAAGVTPLLRWSGCSFQVSTDGGSTYSGLSGFDITTLKGCLPGSPANPQSVSTAQQACNIAAWLAANVLQGSMTQAATNITDGGTLLAGGIALMGVAAALTGVGALAWGAVALFMEAAGPIGATVLNAAAADTTLRSNLTCAIYGAIHTDGQVTSSNFAACATAIAAVSYSTPAVVGLVTDYWNNLGYVGINAIQGEGALYAGDCSACASPPAWCFEWNLATALTPWVLWEGSGNDGHWVSGTGVVGDFDSGGFAKWEIDVNFAFGFTATVTSIEVTAITPSGATGSAINTSDFILQTSGTNHIFNFSTIASATAQVYSHSYGSQACDHAFVRLITDHGATAPVLQKIRLHGTGSNPFGASNCT